MSKKLLTIAIFSAIFIGGAGLFYTQAQNQTKTEILKINDEIQQKKDAIKDLNQQIEEYHKEIKSKEQQVVSLNNQLSIVDSRIKKTSLDIRARELEIESKKLEIFTVENRIGEMNKKIEESKNILAGLLREIYKNDHKNAYLVLLLENSFADFLAEAQFLENLEKGISDQIESVKNTNQQLGQEKIARETEKINLEEQINDLGSKKDDLEEVQYAKQVLTDQTKERARELERTVSELRAQWQTYNNEVGTLEDKLRSRLNEADRFSFKGDIVLSWPIPNYGVVTYFNDPGYPFRYIFEHSGIDIRTLSGGRPTSGLPVRASAPGIVAKIVRESPYGGNIVYIAHASGVVTVYMHLLRISVSPDQEISRGEVIGLSGGARGLPSSGRFTTGPHLHFEVRRNGLPVNPLDYLVSGI